MSEHLPSPETEHEVYIFDPEAFDEETEREIEGFIKWAARVKWEQSKIERTVLSDRENRAVLREWSEKYSGKIPQRWGGNSTYSAWDTIKDDIENQIMPLDDTLVEAAIEYPIWHVPRTLIRRRLLTEEQLKLFLETNSLSERHKEEFAGRQRLLGMPSELTYRVFGVR